MTYVIVSPIHYNVFEFVSLHEGGGGGGGIVVGELLMKRLGCSSENLI